MLGAVSKFSRVVKRRPSGAFSAICLESIKNRGWRSLATVVEQHDSDDEREMEDSTPPKARPRRDPRTVEGVENLTFSPSKAGSPSPWAVFDAWGAGADICDPLSESDEAKLGEDAVKIPMTEEEREDVVGEGDILEAYDRLLQQKSSVHLGYPYNLMYDHSEVYSFMKYSINNLGDPFVPSNYAVHSKQFECAVIDFFAKLWKMEPDSYWGYVTTSGTEGNLHGILLARENHPDGILYTSNESHYSIFKAARYYRMDCRSIPTLPMGEIDYDLLARELDQNREYPAIINVNIGTTVKGAVDNLDRILRILETLEIPRERFHIHCDGALFALMMPFIDYAPEISFAKPIDSIAVSGHKMLGCPMPCGIALCRKEHVEKLEDHIEYLNTKDTTIMGSRNGQAPLYMWYSLRKKGISGIKRDVM
jgi:histidine decarboxylase